MKRYNNSALAWGVETVLLAKKSPPFGVVIESSIINTQSTATGLFHSCDSIH
jgi:hypothetical protein